MSLYICVIKVGLMFAENVHIDRLEHVFLYLGYFYKK